MKNTHISRWCFALKVAGYHLLISLLIAAVTAWIVFKVWYPSPYGVLVGGLNLYGLLVAVDVVCGPLLTLILANPKKSKRETVVDLSLVGAIQLGALIYGLSAVAAARPVIVAFETDRFTVVSAAEIDKQLLEKAPEGLQSLPWSGVRRVGVRAPNSSEEQLVSLEMSLQGIEPSARPDWWLPDDVHERNKIRKKMQPLSTLMKRYPNNQDLNKQVKGIGLPVEQLYYLPFTSQKNKDWTVVLDQQAEFKAFVSLDAF